MPVNTEQWRAGIGTFHGRIFFFSNKKACCNPIIIFKCFFNFFYNSFLSILVLKAGDIELNPGPNKKSHSYFSCCHWNVNSLPTDNYCKVAALKAYNSVYKYDFLCVSETFLNSSFESNDKDLMIQGYNLIWSDHSSNTKRGDVCIYYKESLAVRIVNITSLTEYLVYEVTVQNKKGYVALMHRSPSLSTSKFESFLSVLEDLLSNALCSKSQFTVVLGDLNAKWPAWWSEDITTLHGTQIVSLTRTHGSNQIVSDTTHILPQSSSCIDLIFTDQPNYVIDCGTHPSLHPNCHHQITFCKLNLKVEYPPP